MIFLFDFTRLQIHSKFRKPTGGIDRVDAQYLYYLLATSCRVLFCRVSPKDKRYALVPGKEALEIVKKTFSNWGIADDFNSLNVHPDNYRDLEVGFVEPLLAKHPNETFVYLNISLTRATDVSVYQLENFACYKNFVSVFYIHDLIPIDYPEFCTITPQLFSNFIEHVVTFSDLILTNSEYTKKTIENFIKTKKLKTNCLIETHYIGINEQIKALSKLSPEERISYIQEMQYPEDPYQELRTMDIGQNGYFIYVSTIEGRKNHFLLYLLWKKLINQLGDKTPKLIFIGRKGWCNEKIVYALNNSNGLDNKIIWLQDCKDSLMLALLCSKNCLGTLNPSFVEGYGMPAAESIFLGLVTVCSTADAYREATQNKGIFLDPLSLPQWYDAVYSIIQKGKGVGSDKHINEYRPTTWLEAYKKFESAISLVAGTEPSIKKIELIEKIEKKQNINKLRKNCCLTDNVDSATSKITPNLTAEPHEYLDVSRIPRFFNLLFNYIKVWGRSRTPSLYSIIVFPVHFYRRVKLLW